MAKREYIQANKDWLEAKAKEEGRHASVFHVYTKQALKPKKTMAFIMLTPAVRSLPTRNYRR
jgi:hypothetical protein